MGRFKVTFIYSALLIVASIFITRLETWITRLCGPRFAGYVIFGLFMAFFLVTLIKTLQAGKNLEMGSWLLSAGIIFFFLYFNVSLSFKLEILLFFILGILCALDNKKTKSILPFIMIIAVICLGQLAENLVKGTQLFSFELLNAWMHFLASLAGYVAGFLLL